MPVLLSIVAIVLLPLGWAAVRRPRNGRPLWVLGMLGGELAGWWTVLSLALLVGFRAAGWGHGPFGAFGQVLLVASTGCFGVALARGYGARRGIAATVASAGGGALPRIGLRPALLPISPVPRRVTLDRGLVYGEHARHRVDRIGPAVDGVARPAFIHIHGGGWWRGRHTTQARPLVHHLAAAGWQVFTPSYRLSPEATAPDHLVDVKRMIAWVRANAAELGVDPTFIAIAGGSTGGNLAALAALTAGDRSLQPGFEDADTSVQCCVPLYGVHDLLDDRGRPLWPYLASDVVKVDPADDPEAWHRVSPIRLARSDRPPFLVIHGAADTLVDPDLSRRLVAALTAAGGPPVMHLEVPWGNHGFDFFAGPRGTAVATAIGAMLRTTHHAARPAERGTG